MIRKNIIEMCEKVHKKLVKSIKDPTVQSLVRDNMIITGGAITSMLLNEKVNDYDIYFRDLFTTKRVAEYYVSRFKEVCASQFVDPKVIVEGDRVRIHIQSIGVAEAERPEEPLNLEDGENLFTQVGIAIPIGDEEENISKSERKDLDPIYLTDNAITLKGGVQIVIRFWGTPSEIHKNYDFVHCTNYWTPNEGLVLNANALESILAKQLIYNGSKYPLCSIIRTRKFIKRGWSCNAGQYLKMCFQVSQLDLRDIPTLKEQLIGVDAAYFNSLISRCEMDLLANPDLKMDDLYIAELVDKIFG